MAKRIKQILTISLCLAALAQVFASCSATDAGTQKEAPESALSESSVIDENVSDDPRMAIKDNLPADLNYSGASYVIYIQSDGPRDDYIQGPEELGGDVVFDAVYTRNKTVEERLNIKLEHHLAGTVVWDSTEMGNDVRKLVLSGDSTYDIIHCVQYGMVGLVADGMFRDISSGEYFDFSKPWWWNNYMNEISIGSDRRFFLVGEYFIHMFLGTQMLYFNKNIWEQYYGDPNELYNEVLDGKWTLEKLTNYVKPVYSDVNGDGDQDTEDIYGFTAFGRGSAVDAFVYGTDIDFVLRDSEGNIQLNMSNERSVKLAEILNELFWDNGTYIYNENKAVDSFAAGKALFLGNAYIDTSTLLRDMENDYGMLPNPKFSEEQEEYRSIVHDARRLGVVPASSDSVDFTSAVMEAMCSESYRSVFPAFYDTALKVKYARDDVSSQMLDLIHDSITTSFVFTYNYSLSNLGLIYRELVGNGSNDFVSLYARKEKAALTALDKFITTYNEKQ